MKRLCAVVLAACLAVPLALRADLDPKAVSYIPVDRIQWVDNAAGTNARSVIYGDASKPEPYAYFVKWKQGNMSRPHWHPNDRHIVVLAGTWWVGSGPSYEPDSTVPLAAGTYVLHTGRQVHYDGAKEGDAVLLIYGMGPDTSTPAATKP
jgi:hypothetical protein